jgi:hypothetical protein
MKEAPAFLSLLRIGARFAEAEQPVSRDQPARYCGHTSSADPSIKSSLQPGSAASLSPGGKVRPHDPRDRVAVGNPQLLVP